MPYHKFIEYMNERTKLIKKIGFKEAIKDPWSALQELMKEYKMMTNLYDSIHNRVMKSTEAVKRFYKREISGEWVAINLQ